MRVLVACEFSGMVSSTFRRYGCDAWSCDLLPTDGDVRYHIEGDVRDVLGDGWDLMIAFPPCTHLAISGAHVFKHKKEKQEEALKFVRTLLDAPIPHICIENPVSIIRSRIRRPSQIIQPFQFGHDAHKTTCLWLKKLHGLIIPHPSTWAKPRYVNGMKRWSNQTDSGQSNLGPSEDRWMKRARTYQGIANAMASRWCNIIPEEETAKPWFHKFSQTASPHNEEIVTLHNC